MKEHFCKAERSVIAYMGKCNWCGEKELAQPEQEPVCPDCKAKVLYECVACSSNNYPAKHTEQNFCSRCGKRTSDPFTIHTCTPPQEKNHVAQETD